jgi:hypothetical protein
MVTCVYNCVWDLKCSGMQSCGRLLWCRQRSFDMVERDWGGSVVKDKISSSKIRVVHRPCAGLKVKGCSRCGKRGRKKKK